MLRVAALLTLAYVAPLAAHDAHRLRSLGGLHDGASSVARRAAFAASLAAEPALGASATAACDLTHATEGYWESCGGAVGNAGSFSRLVPAAAEAACCANATCAGFSFGCDDASCATGSGYYKNNLDCGFVNSAAFQGWAKPSRLPVLPNVAVSISPSSPLTEFATIVTVTFSFVTGSVNRTTDWVGQVCAGSPIEDYIEYAPIDFFSNWESGTGSFSFTVFRTRCDYEFRYFRGKQPLWPVGVTLGVSPAVTWAGLPWATHPFHTHVAFGGDDAQHSMVVSFTTNSTSAGDVTVMVGAAPGLYTWNATDVDSTTYGASDLCNAPANTTGIDYWQWPGVFHHVTVRNLEADTRYYARPVAGNFVGDEISFVTGAPLSASARTVFAAFGDMSDTGYVLDGDSDKDTPDGGPGAVGTSQRLRSRIDAGEPLNFVLHFGDLGYAKGAIFLWDAWMSLMSNIGESVPYMVSIGNHEYDYRYPSANDPSGVSGGVHNDMPQWFDGDVDSLGECGVGTERRFRSPQNGNHIFWYAFSTGSVSVITLSSEHSVAPGSPQRAFLEGALAAVNRTLTPWLVVTFHREVYSLTGDEQPLQDGYLAWMEDLFYSFKVDLVFNGHIHQSQRTFPVYNYTRRDDAPVYIISGSAGAMLEPSPAENSTGLVAWSGLGSCGFYVVDCLNETHARLMWSRNNDSAILDDAWVVRSR
jgi:hypothetical protein